MNFIEFIKEYQTLIGSLLGSFIAIISSLTLWYLKQKYDDKKQIETNKKEIECIFIAASRESEDAMKDLAGYILTARNSLTNKKINLVLPPRFNRIYINEERLFTLKKGLDFIVSQQIDIAVSSAKKFNGYLDRFEIAPQFIFDSTIKLLQSNLISKEEVIENYHADQIKNLDHMEFNLKGSMLVAQRHLFRPIVAQAPKYRDFPEGIDIDKELDIEADFVLAAAKKDLE